MPDFNRALTSDGVATAQRIGQEWKATGFVPDYFLSSAAVRARQTAEHIAGQCDIDPDSIVFERLLYATDEFTLLHRLTQLPEGAQTAVLVNHNPAISALVEYLTDSFTDMLRQGSIARLELDTSWAELSGGSARLINMAHPKQ